jgi:arachidonate 15-lipoxygenase
MSSIEPSKRHYRYDPNQLGNKGPLRLFPHNGRDGLIPYIVNQLLRNLANRGTLTQLIEWLERFRRDVTENWIKITTLLVDLKIFQSDFLTFDLPSNEQFDDPYNRVRRKAGLATETAKLKVKTVNSPTEKRDRFYKVLTDKTQVPAPAVIKIFERDGGLSDREFARQRLAGPNPMMIYRVQDQSTLAGLDLPNVNLSELAEQNRLFAIDYPLLNFAPADLHLDRYVGNSKALFYRGDQGLEPLLIELERGGKIFTPKSEADDWMRAKLYTQVADVTQHELMTHLCYTHLAMEAFAIATPSQIPKTHPIYRFLTPHLRFILAVNVVANSVLLAKGGAVDKLLAPTLESCAGMINKGFRAKPFKGYSFTEDVQQRGIGAEFLPEFAYRDDAAPIWMAIQRYVGAYVQHFYKSDEAVLSDRALQSWAAELGATLNTRSVEEFAQAPGWLPSSIAEKVGLVISELPDYPRLPDFPTAANPGKLMSVQELIDVLTTVIFTNTVQHSAVNYCQFDYLGYVPNSPLAAHTRPDVPSSIQDLLPNSEKELGQIELTYTLSEIRWSELGNSDYIKFNNADEQAILKSFQSELATIETEIQHRNQKRLAQDGIDYPYLLPSQISNSINI